MNNLNYLPIILTILFIFGYIVALLCISFFAGWFRLGKKYSFSNQSNKIIAAYRWRSINLNYLGAYRCIVHFKISETGLLIEPSFLLFFFHKPLFFVWDTLEQVRYKNKAFRSMIFKVERYRVVIWGGVAEDSFKEYKKAKSSSRS